MTRRAETETGAQTARHSLFEDAQGIVFGAAMCAFGVHILTSAGLVTGQTAGLAVLLSYAAGWPFGLVFFLINLPFYWLGYRRIGLAFTIKTFVAVALLSVFTPLMPMVVSFERLDPLAAALLFGVVTGPGLLALFRHGASLGGVGILALWLQDRMGIQAGWVQLGFDAVLFAAALIWLEPALVAFSLAGALVINVMIAVNHRRDRYIGT